MTEIDHQTPPDPRELEARFWQFPKALDQLLLAKKVVAKLPPGTSRINSTKRNGKTETYIVDNEVIKLMSGGIEKMYKDLCASGYREFAETVLREKEK